MSEYKAHARRMRGVICDAMIRLLEEKPFSKITVSNILEEAQIQRATFYHYFRDKYEVAETINQTLADTLTSGMAANKHRGPAFDEETARFFDLKYRKVLGKMLVLHVETIDLCQVLINTFRKRYECIYSGCSEFESYLASRNFIALLLWIIEMDIPFSELENAFALRDHINVTARFYSVQPEALLNFVVSGGSR